METPLRPTFYFAVPKIRVAPSRYGDRLSVGPVVVRRCSGPASELSRSPLHAEVAARTGHYTGKVVRPPGGGIGVTCWRFTCFRVPRHAAGATPAWPPQAAPAMSRDRCARRPSLVSGRTFGSIDFLLPFSGLLRLSPVPVELHDPLASSFQLDLLESRDGGHPSQHSLITGE